LSGVSVHRETREKVLAKARDLGYRQNIFASNLRTQRTNLLGIVVSHLNDRETANIVSQVELIAREVGYDVIVSQSLNDPDIHQNIIEGLANKRVDALLVLPADFSTSVSRPVEMTELRIPSLFLEGWLAKRDEEPKKLKHAAYTFTKHLISKGCRRIAYIATRPNNASNEVLQGCRQALVEDELSSEISLAGGAHFEQAMRKCVDLLTTEAVPDGFIFLDETVTAFSIPSLRENRRYTHGKRIELSDQIGEENFQKSSTRRNEIEAARVVANMLFTIVRQGDHIFG
jgi:LacI family transcriptional regulator